MNAIDLTAEVDEAKQGHPRYWQDDAVQRRVALVHGADLGRDCNEHGVFTDAERIVIKGEPRFCEAEIRVVRTPRGHWLQATSTQIHDWGHGSMPGIGAKTAYPTRDDAILAGLDETIDRCDRDHHTETTSAKARKLKAAVEAYRENLLQPSLF